MVAVRAALGLTLYRPRECCGLPALVMVPAAETVTSILAEWFSVTLGLCVNVPPSVAVTRPNGSAAAATCKVRVPASKASWPAGAVRVQLTSPPGARVGLAGLQAVVANGVVVVSAMVGRVSLPVFLSCTGHTTAAPA